MKVGSRLLAPLLLALAALCAFAGVAFAAFNDLQGFEVNPGDWVAPQAITRVPSGGGTLHLTARSGSYYAELRNLHDGYGVAGYGDGGYSFFGGKDPVYHGPFYQAVDLYVDVNWAPATFSEPSFWIDMTPYHADPANYGAEHNFRLTAEGTSVKVTVAGQSTPLATLTQSGWYSFVMSYRRAANLTDPAITDASIYGANLNLIGTTTVYATSPGGPFASSDLRGNGYVWITAWQNGFADDVLGIDNVRTGLAPFGAPTSKDQCKNGGWQTFTDPSFKSDGDCVLYVNMGK